MAKAAIELLLHPDRLDTMAKAARQHAQQHFCTTRIIPLYEQFYEQVLAQPILP